MVYKLKKTVFVKFSINNTKMKPKGLPLYTAIRNFWTERNRKG